MTDDHHSPTPERQEPSNGPVRFGAFRFDPSTLELFGPDGAVELAPTPARVLAVLIEAAGEVVPREELWRRIWPKDRYDLDQKLNFAIHHLRKALGDEAASPRFVQTLPRRGYRFVAPVRSEEDRTRSRGVLVGMAAGIAILIVAPFFSGSDSPVRVDRSSPGSEALSVAEHLLERGREGDGELAEEYFWEALDRDPELAAAWVGLGLVHDDRGDRQAAAYFLGQALEISPDLTELHQVLARHAIEEGAWEKAGDHLHQAVQAPDAGLGAHRALAHYAAIVGDRAEALRQVEMVRALDPGAAIDAGDAGWLYYWSGEPRRAAAACGEHEKISGVSPLSRACLFSAFMEMGDQAGAAEVARYEWQASHDDTPLEPGVSDTEAIDRFLSWRWAMLSEMEGHHYAKARVAAYRGDWTETVDELDAATDAGEVGVRYVLAEPLFEPIRRDEDFVAVVGRIGLPLDRVTETP